MKLYALNKTAKKKEQSGKNTRNMRQGFEKKHRPGEPLKKLMKRTKKKRKEIVANQMKCKRRELVM